VRGALPAVPFEQPRRRVEQEREEQVFWLGEIQGALEGAPGGTLLAERVTGDRFEQERLNPPVLGVHQGSGAVDDGASATTAASGEQLTCDQLPGSYLKESWSLVR